MQTALWSNYPTFKTYTERCPSNEIVHVMWCDSINDMLSLPHQPFPLKLQSWMAIIYKLYFQTKNLGVEPFLPEFSNLFLSTKLRSHIPLKSLVKVCWNFIRSHIWSWRGQLSDDVKVFQKYSTTSRLLFLPLLLHYKGLRDWPLGHIVSEVDYLF